MPRTIQRRIVSALEGLAQAPYPQKAIKLEGGDGELRIRIGDYRVIYEVHEDVLLVLVLKVGHRKDVYRRR